MGANMRFMDVGGGLAIDYDGSFTDSTASMSYTVQHYANDGKTAASRTTPQRGHRLHTMEQCFTRCSLPCPPSLLQ